MKNSVGISLQLWKKRAALWTFKIERVSFMNSNKTAQRCYQQSQLKIMLRRTHTQKKRLSKMNTKNVCWLTLSFTFSCAIFIYLLQSTCCRRAGMCIDWWIFAMPYSFSCIFLRTWLMLIIPFISSCSQLLHAGEFLWMYLLINSSSLQQLANNVPRYCFLLEKNMLPTWHFLYYWNNRAAAYIKYQIFFWFWLNFSSTLPKHT